MKILFYGDIVGRIGRQAMAVAVPEMSAKYAPDLIIANVENIAHGVGTTVKTLAEVEAAGVQFFTSGNHALKKPEIIDLLNAPDSKLIRPDNLLDTEVGTGYKIIKVNNQDILIINLMGQVFMKYEYANPFHRLDAILDKVDLNKISAIIVDFHAEATSEKVAFAWYANGRVSAVLGTHTHVPTADQKILSGGTAYVTDVGMVGARESVIGNTKEEVIDSFVNETNHKMEIPETGLVDVGAVLIEIDSATKQAIKIERVDTTVSI